ncbi:uncharacterized protein B0H18DRAFT_1044261 [Fomitopsis serialis]|uniref:uncharacterized protein n=1 Tax=Fomitopsis serialis TaxID=139415 RepID=UPI002007F360|nr:uncharacterized protein B0H18DRAFT_1044261 [Neoantrodia serialis]KAH9914695.1 hypothetical protein B0H18DRAFT_1044261 [Neoantrodia serialis]
MATTTLWDPVGRVYVSSVVHGRELLAPHYHPKTHGVPVALIHFYPTSADDVLCIHR